jgi:hypothetical protein
MNWPAFAKKLLLLDNRIDDVKTKVLRRAILEDGLVDRQEVEFLLDLKHSAGSVHPDFDAFVCRVLKKLVLSAKKEVSDANARWLRKVLLVDKEVTASERHFIQELKLEAKKFGPEFRKLYDDVIGLRDTELSRN